MAIPKIVLRAIQLLSPPEEDLTTKEKIKEYVERRERELFGKDAESNLSCEDKND